MNFKICELIQEEQQSINHGNVHQQSILHQSYNNNLELEATTSNDLCTWCISSIYHQLVLFHYKPESTYLSMADKKLKNSMKIRIKR